MKRPDQKPPEKQLAAAASKRRTAADAGWHLSRYNISAPLPDTDNVIIANLFKGTCRAYTPLEGYLLSVLDELNEGHPAIALFAEQGVICNFDERAALETLGRAACASAHEVELTICPTMRCNFACPYCFQDHGLHRSVSSNGSGERMPGAMSPEVQDSVVALVERLLDASGAKQVRVMWFGGEPLLAPQVIESLSARLIALAEEYDAAYHAAITTNGYLLNQGMADLLGKARVETATIALDGLGATHDATRHLAGGGATFERIAENLRTAKLPFGVGIRHNVHEGNLSGAAELEAFIEHLAAESGNKLTYFPAPILANPTAGARGNHTHLTSTSAACSIAIREATSNFEPGRGHYCGAQSIFSTAIDDCGRLYKCWEEVDKPHRSFGTAKRWNPADPLATADNPNQLTRYLNTAGPIPDEECRACVWLPLCVGGCPNKRLFETRLCMPFKDDPARFALALYASTAKNA